MPVRHFYLLPHYSCNGLFFLFSVCWLHVNEFNGFWEELRGRGQKTTVTQKVCLFGIFTCSHITFAMVYSFYFLFVGSRRNEFNSLWGDKGGRGQKSTTCSEDISVMEFYLLAPTLHLQWSISFFVCFPQISFSLYQKILCSIRKQAIFCLKPVSCSQVFYHLLNYF